MAASYRTKYFNNTYSMLGKYRCAHCGKWFDKRDIDVDHIIPQSKGGTDDLVNLQALCKHCNRSKQDDTSRTIPDLAGNIVKTGAKIALKKIFK